MTPVLISLEGRKAIVTKTSLARPEINELIDAMGPEITHRFIYTSQTSPVTIRGTGDAAIEAFLLSSLEGESNPEEEFFPEPVFIPTDPCLVDVVNSEGTGITSVMEDGSYLWTAYHEHREVYQVMFTTQEDALATIGKLDADIAVMTDLKAIITGLIKDFPPRSTNPPQVDLTAPISKEAARKRMGSLLAPVDPAPHTEAPNYTATFLLQMEGSHAPLQILIHGDGERLRDIGYLHQLQSKYPKEVSYTPEYQVGLSMVSIPRKMGKCYIETLRSILIDCNLVQDYSIESIEYVPSQTVLPEHIRL